MITVSLRLIFTAILTSLHKKINTPLMKGDYESMRSEQLNSKWKEDYTKIDSVASVEDKWASLKAVLSKLRDTYVTEQKSNDRPRWKEGEVFL